MTSPERTWWARKNPSRVERRASGAALRVGQRLRTSPKERRILFGKPWQDLWKGVFEGTGQAMGTPDFVTDQATAVCDEVGEGAHGGAVGLQGCERVTVCEEACDLACGIGGVVFGAARGKRFAVPGHGERIDGKEHEEIILAPCGHDGAFLECQAHRARVSMEARAQSLDPRVDGFRAVCEAQALPPRSASGLSANLVFGIRPIEADTGGNLFWRQLGHV